MTTALKVLEGRLGYRFSDSGLLEQALTHRSVGSENNERLEFLGDSILNFTVTTALYDLQPGSNEGDLSRIRASLVNGTMLAGIADELQLAEFIRVGQGELRSGGRRRMSIQADALEAIFGAVLLDGGIEKCQQLILKIYSGRLKRLPDAESLKDPKTRLQEYLQGKGLELPVYQIIEESGREHQKHFKVACKAANLDEVVGQGSSRRKAEQDAASNALALIKNV